MPHTYKVNMHISVFSHYVFLAFLTHPVKGDSMYVLFEYSAFKILYYENTLLYFAVYDLVIF